MISENSPLKKLSVRIEPEDAFFIDGLRHAAEISTLGYNRLRVVLTSLALDELNKQEIDEHSTAAFLDAWTLIDAVYRFRSLWTVFTAKSKRVKGAEELALEGVLQSVSDLRNLADHLAVKAQRVISKHSASLGSLSWFTASQEIPIRGWLCLLTPGTLLHNLSEIPAPRGRTFVLPTGVIRLDAGGFSVCLCDLMPYLAQKIQLLEDRITAVNAGFPVEEQYAGSTTFLKFYTELDGTISKHKLDP